MWIHVYPKWKTNFDSKNGRKKSVPYETKASKSFITMKRMLLRCPIMEWKDIIMWKHVYHNWKTNLNFKNGRNCSFSYEAKASISFIQIRRMCLWCPIMKRKEINMWIHVHPNWQMNFDSKKWWDVKFFLWNQSIN